MIPYFFVVFFETCFFYFCCLFAILFDSISWIIFVFLLELTFVLYFISFINAFSMLSVSVTHVQEVP